MKVKNPFNPSFGKVPAVFIDRDHISQVLIDGFKDPSGPAQTTLITGVRGVGKTALLTDVCEYFENEKNWIVCDIPSNSNILETLIQTIQVKADSGLKKSFASIDQVSLSLMGFSITFTPQSSSANYQLLLEELLKKMQKQDQHLLIAIDEVIANRSIKQFASIYQIMLRKNYPIALLMTGLPKNISELQNDDVLTFLLRSNRISLPMLNEINVHYNYKSVFEAAGKTIEENALKKMTSLTKGYSYAFQLLGYLLWETNESTLTNTVIDSIMDRYKENLFRNAYTKIYEELSDMDRKILNAMALTDTPVPMKELAGLLKKKPNYISTYRRRLLDSGVIISPSYGYVDYSLPLFKDYILEFCM